MKIDLLRYLHLILNKYASFTVTKWRCIQFFILIGRSRGSYFYVYDDKVGAKGQNVISFLHHFKNFITPEVRHLYLFMGNCISQNKDYVLTQFLFIVVKLGKFAYATYRFLELGHSFFPCSRSFALIEKKTYDYIYLPHYHKIIHSAGKSLKL